MKRTLSQQELAVLESNRDIFEYKPGPELKADAVEFARNSQSKNTLKAYTASLRIFNAWCEVHGYDPLACTAPR